MSFKNYLKSKVKYVLGIASLAAIVSQLVFPVLSSEASGARFNFLTGDLEMIRGANVTQGATGWTNPITGTAGDEFRGIVYYHNGMLDTVATNTRIKVNIPGATVNKTAKITGSISADNADTVTSTVVDGQLIGHDGLIVNFDQNVDLEFVPGSVKWFPDSSVSGGPNQVPVALPFGQTGNEIVSANGVKLGDIQGCWDHAGYVTFGFKSKAKAAPTLTLSKTVKNDTKGDVSLTHSTTAEAGNNLTYKVDVTNSGTEGLENVIVKDTLPGGVTYTPNTLVEYEHGSNMPVSLNASEASQFFSNGLNIGSLPAGQGVKTSFQFQAKVDANAHDCMINTALVTAAGLSASDTAKVCLVAPNIVKSKSAYNITKSEPANIAEAGNTIEYTLTTKNTGSASIQNFVIEDDLSQVLNYSDLVSVSDGGTIVTPNGVKTVRWEPVSIAPNQTVIRKFTVKVVNPLPVTPSELKLINFYGNQVVIIIKRPPVPPQMSVSKYVKDISTGEGNFVKSDQAYAGDILEYRINFTNIGTVPADQVRIYDTLPANTQFISGTTVISRNGGTEKTLPDGITAGGTVLDSVAVGESGYIKFRVSTSTGLAKGENLVNTVFLSYDHKTISDTASTVIVAKGTPIVPATTSLPKTGPGSLPGATTFMLTFLMGIAFLYTRYRKVAFAEEKQIYDGLIA